ncbi:MAG: sulfurtransferase TusA family protein [Nitrospirae bacterium]|nr:sulfurtransferase TusA family protein [Nitrospirota bacterium]
MSEMKADEKLDLRGEICPYNFVKTKLKLEEMEIGQILEVVIDNGEPIKNVPRSLKEDGHQILKVERIEQYFKLVIKKS